jgi:hypothetical protein
MGPRRGWLHVESQGRRKIAVGVDLRLGDRRRPTIRGLLRETPSGRPPSVSQPLRTVYAFERTPLPRRCRPQTLRVPPRRLTKQPHVFAVELRGARITDLVGDRLRARRIGKKETTRFL